MVALGDDAPTTPQPTAAEAVAAEVREDVEQVNETAREDAPPAVGNHCNATLDVEGIGDTCVTSDGLLRVEQADGQSYTIHGVDAPPVGAASFAPGSMAAVAGAGPKDVTCTGADQPHYTLVYAHPADVASRSTTIAPKLRTEAYKLGAFLDSESRAVSPGAGRSLPIKCDGGAPVVLTANLTTLSSGTASFGTLVDALKAQGYEYNGKGSGMERYIVYYDSPSPTGAAGTGHVFTSDSSGAATNQNNVGGLYAVEYRYDGGGGVPHWETLIHEVVHTMGAVSNDAPHTSGVASNGAGAGHCTDGQDVMCYADGGSNAYNGSVCATKVLDCNRDDYFNPDPAPGSYLATHWNAAAPYNRFLVAGKAGDVTPPTQVTGLRQTGTSNVAVGVAWSVASDDAAVVGYAVSVRPVGGAWRDAGSTSRTATSITGLAASSAFEVSVAAKDAAGNVGPAAVLAVSTNDQPDHTAPSAPSALAAKTTMTNATFSWNDAADDVGVQGYELRRITPSADPTRRETRSAGTTPNTTITVPLAGLKPGQRVQFELVARDGAANVSLPAKVTITVPKDARRPTAPANLRVVVRTTTKVTFAWTASRDNVAVTGYRAYQLVGRRWVLRGNLAANISRLGVTGLRRGSSYTFRLVARDAAGNLSTPSRPIVLRPR